MMKAVAVAMLSFNEVLLENQSFEQSDPKAFVTGLTSFIPPGASEFGLQAHSGSPARASRLPPRRRRRVHNGDAEDLP